MRVISFRFGDTGVSIKKSTRDQVTAKLKNCEIVFSVKDDMAEPLSIPPALDKQLLSHLQWAIVHYFGRKKNT